MRVELTDSGRGPRFEIQLGETGSTVHVKSLEEGRRLARWIRELDPAAPKICILCGESVEAGEDRAKWGFQWPPGWLHYACVGKIAAALVHLFCAGKIP